MLALGLPVSANWLSGIWTWPHDLYFFRPLFCVCVGIYAFGAVRNLEGIAASRSVHCLLIGARSADRMQVMSQTGADSSRPECAADVDVNPAEAQVPQPLDPDHVVRGKQRLIYRRGLSNVSGNEAIVIRDTTIAAII